MHRSETFRLIIVTRKPEMPKVLQKTFGLLSVEEDLVEKEQKDLKLRIKHKDHAKTVLANNSLLEACFEGDVHTIKNLVMEKGADINCTDHYGNTPLMEAALRGNYMAMQFLLQHDPFKLNLNAQNSEERTALHKAAYNGHH